MAIPFVDLKAQYATIKEEIDDAVSDIIRSCQFIGGPAVTEFEKSFAAFSGAGHGVGVSSGTAAIHLALVGLGVGPGDEVITACNTFIATAEAITHAGARPVFVDVEDDTQLIDAEKVEASITPRTRAIIPVHLYGQPADMSAISDVAKRHSLKVVADAAQAHGSDIGGNRSAIHGDATTFSFYPGKNLGAYGDAGMILTDDGEMAARIRALSNHGRSEKYLHFAEGWNHRMDGIQAAILGVKLRHLDAWTEGRRSRADRYNAAFAPHAGIRPVSAKAGRRHVYHLYVVRCADRDAAMKSMAERGISTGIHYPVPLHMQPAYEYLAYSEGAFPVAENAAREIVSLPMYAELADEMVDEVATTLIDMVAN